MRKRCQVLVLPYKKSEDEIKYGIFKRKDIGAWQGVAGGVETGETIIQTALRELAEETGVEINDDCLVPLKSKAEIPSENIRPDMWGDEGTVPEYAFGVDLTGKEVEIGEEHVDMVWVVLSQALRKLRFESNKVALKELDELLKGKDK